MYVGDEGVRDNEWEKQSIVFHRIEIPTALFPTNLPDGASELNVLIYFTVS
ncbi:MAG: hypothetical protein GXO86_05210 [Chlorobi bacterium]|nr:hypothetical protein [Chlorobiota bacterium]